MERRITIEIPETSFKAIEKPYESGNYPTVIAVNAEVARVVEVLKREGLVTDDDELTVNLRGSKQVSVHDATRHGTVETIYREDAGGKGGIDSSKDSFTVELAQDANN